MIIQVKKIAYTHPHTHMTESLEIGDQYVDWQGFSLGSVKLIQIFTGTGARIMVGEQQQEHWVHWGRIAEWVAVKQ